MYCSVSLSLLTHSQCITLPQSKNRHTNSRFISRYSSSDPHNFTTTSHHLKSNNIFNNHFLKYSTNIIGNPITFACASMIKITEPKTNIEFPIAQNFWDGQEFRCLGVAVRIKKVAFVGVNVYAIGLYVEAERTLKELKIRNKGGFLKSPAASDQEYADVILDGAFNKVLQFEMARKISSEQFSNGIDEALRPKLQFLGELKSLEEFKEFVTTQVLDKGTKLILLSNVKGYMDIYVLSPNENLDNYSKVKPMKKINSAAFCRALLEMYMGETPIIPDAKLAWSQGAKKLLQSTTD